ncbi:hypothetical protein [Micromonospora sp. CPCC 205558]|uniref:hypothetical protein n=1 Tax=Micromonospora sp. CPCC 205558 TaxID=3122403 RepID=UPI002FF1D19D
MMFKRSDLPILALALGLVAVGLFLRENTHGTAQTVGRVLTPLGYLCGLAAFIGPSRRARRENARLRAALLEGATTPEADERPDRPKAEDGPNR